MTKFLTKRNIYISLFAILYISVALVSTIHAVSFFALANMTALAVLLACTFEIGQASVLFSILTSKKERSKFVPWLLMCVLTLVQVLGNVFSSYKYLILNSSENLRFFKEPVFIWTELPDNMCNVILTYIIGSIMPIVALLMTSMVANYLEDTAEENNISNDKQKEINDVVKEFDEIVETTKLPEINEDEQKDLGEQIEEVQPEQTEETIVNQTEDTQKSHFVNL